MFQACCLCNMRGGALKPTTTDKWCHVVCVLPIGDIQFQDSVYRQPVNVNKISAPRKKLVGSKIVLESHHNCPV